MEIPVEKICNFFKCYDTNVNKLHLNQTAKNFLAPVGLRPSKINLFTYIKIIPIVCFFHMLCFGQVGHIIHYLCMYTYLYPHNKFLYLILICS